MAAQLYDIDILNYDMHKYIEIFKLLREFELLYDIEFFFQKEKMNKSIFIVELLLEFKFSSQTRNK